MVHPQTFTAPDNGVYKVELWGASGGNNFNDYTKTVPAYGGYTAGDIKLNKNDTLYIYVGATKETFNCCSQQGGNSGSGGATDIRLTNGTWNDFNSLKSRIMVAGGGGGPYSDSSAPGGGHAGGLNSYTSSDEYYPISASTQTAGGAAGYAGTAGGFGYGGINTNANTAYNTGAGGYYGGGSGPGGGGGSSFISGHNGCNAIAESSTESSITHTGQSVHYSGKKFTKTVMIDGKGCSWTNVLTTDCQGIPNYAGNSKQNGNNGNDGNGYAKITYIG